MTYVFFDSEKELWSVRKPGESRPVAYSDEELKRLLISRDFSIVRGPNSSRLAVLGLRNGQLRVSRSFGHNAQWYDGKRRYIGFGDLEDNDVRSVMSALAPEEKVFILPEEVVFSEEKTGWLNPPDFVFVEKASWVITEKIVFTRFKFPNGFYPEWVQVADFETWKSLITN